MQARQLYPAQDKSYLTQNMLLLASLLTFLSLASPAVGHGRLMDPPARNSMWRLGFPNPVNYNDNELYCGGREAQWSRNKGRCGVCGDPHHHPNREHEVGGKYANGIISRQYKQGQVIDVTVHITANHKGYFEFRICPVENSGVEVTQECLNKHVLEMVGVPGTRFKLPEGKSNSFFNVSLRLPANMTCKQCVIQWKYRTGNTWDKDEDGSFCLGCGPQEEFYNCADVTINPADRNQNDNPIAHAHIENMPTALNDLEKSNKNSGDVVVDKTTQDKITNYGQNKITFFQNLHKSAHNLLDKSGHSRLETDANYQRPNIVQKHDPSDSQSGKNFRFSYLNDGHQDEKLANVVAMDTSRTPDVVYQWKNDMPNNPSVENILHRFGYGSVWIKRDKNEDQYGSKKRETLGKLTSGSNNYGYDKSKTLSEQTGIRIYNGYQSPFNGHSQFGLGSHSNLRHGSQLTQDLPSRFSHGSQPSYGAHSGLGLQHEQNLQSRISLGSQPTLSSWPSQDLQSRISLGSQPDLDSQPRLDLQSQPNLDSITSPSHVQNAATHLPSNLRNRLSKTTLSPLQRDSFLRKWKLLRLRHLSAIRALSASKPTAAPTANLWNEKSLSPQRNPAQVTSKTTLMTMKTSKPKDTIYNNEIHNLNQISTSRESFKTKMQNNRQTYIQKKLPTWLVMALRIKHREYDNNDYHVSENSDETASSQNDMNGNSRSDQDDVVIMSGGRVTQQEGANMKQNNNKIDTVNAARNWYNIGTRSSGLTSDVLYTNSPPKRQNIDTSMRKRVWWDEMINANKKEASKQMKLTPKIKPEASVAKTSDNVENVNSDTSSLSNQDTESLVRYIIKLLFSHQHSQTNVKSMGQTNIKPKSVTDNSRSRALLSNNLLHSDWNNSTSDRNSWFAPSHVEIPIARMDFENSKVKNKRVFYPEKEAHQNTGFVQIDNAYNQQLRNDQENRPSIEKARPFKSIILGSDYGNIEGHTIDGSKNSNEGNLLRSYIKEDTIGSKINHGNLARNTNYYLYRQDDGANQIQASDNNVITPTKVATAGSHDDYRHMWTVRSQNRMEETSKLQLICKSLVTLGGGMDRWCNDNCNANFCPPSMCVCKPRPPTSSVYTFDRTFAPSQQNLHLWENAGPLKPDQTMARTYRQPYSSGSGAYLDGYVNIQNNDRLSPLFSLTENGEENFEPNDRTTGQNVDNSLISQNFVENVNDAKSLSINLIGPDSNYIQESPKVVQSEGVLDTNTGRSVNSDQFYWKNLNSNSLGYATEVIPGRGLVRQQNPIRGYHNQMGLLNSSPYTGNNNRFQNHRLLPESPSWLSGTRESNDVLENLSNEQDKITNFINTNFNDRGFSGKDRVSSTDYFSQGKNYNIPQELDSNNVGRNQIYPQFTQMNNPNWQDVRVTPKCKAIGAYAGLKHFDEWCDTTCASAVCPLLICSCES